MNTGTLEQMAAVVGPLLEVRRIRGEPMPPCTCKSAPQCAIRTRDNHIAKLEAHAQEALAAIERSGRDG